MSENNPKQAAAARRRKMRRMLDLGHSHEEIEAAFPGTSAVALRRDLRAIEAEDEGKNILEMASERIIRLAEEELRDPSTPATARSRTLATLQKAQIDLLRARGEIYSVPGRGNVVRPEPPGNAFGDEEDDLPHETEEWEWHVQVTRVDDRDYRVRRRIKWLDGYDPPEELHRPTPECPYFMNFEHHLLPLSLDHDRRGHVFDKESRALVGTYQFGEGDISPDHLPFPQREDDDGPPLGPLDFEDEDDDEWWWEEGRDESAEKAGVESAEEETNAPGVSSVGDSGGSGISDPLSGGPDASTPPENTNPPQLTPEERVKAMMLEADKYPPTGRKRWQLFLEAYELQLAECDLTERQRDDIRLQISGFRRILA